MTDDEYPFNIELQREAIDEHKANRLANPWVQDAYTRISKAQCVKAWIEQIGDASLYQQRWEEIDKEDRIAETGDGDVS